MINYDKTLVLHFRKWGKEGSTFKFSFGDHHLLYSGSYTYLDFITDERMTYEVGICL